MSAEQSIINQEYLDNDVSKEYLTVTIGGQPFGIPVLKIQDVLQKQIVTRIPLSQAEVAGSLNLRGRIVTAINMRKLLNIEESDNVSKDMNVVVEHGNELYSLMVDSVGDVLLLSDDTFEKNPSTMEKHWNNISSGIHRLDNLLLVIIDVEGLFQSFDVDE